MGPANNQLADDSVADELHARGIAWAPDPVVSAAGIIGSVAREITGLAGPEAKLSWLPSAAGCGRILDESARSGLSPHHIAAQRIRERLAPPADDTAGQLLTEWRAAGACQEAGAPGTGSRRRSERSARRCADGRIAGQQDEANRLLEASSPTEAKPPAEPEPLRYPALHTGGWFDLFWAGRSTTTR